MNEIVDISFEDIIERAALTDVFEKDFFALEFNYRTPKPGKSIMSPVRFGAVTLILCKDGELSLFIDYREYRLKKNMLMLLNGLQVIDNIHDVSNCLDGYVVIVSPQLVKSITDEMQGINRFMTNDRLKPIAELNEAEMQCLVDNIERIIKMQRDTSHAFQSNILRNEISNLVFEALNIRIKRIKNLPPPDKSERKEGVVREFIHLLLANCKKHHEVSFYAEKLCMTVGNLSRITKAYSGKKAIKWINDVLITESKMLLRKPDNTIQQIADELNFGDQSSFGKFFKKHTGLTPREYRKSVQK